MVIPPLNNFKIKNWFKVCSSWGIYVSTRHWKSSLLLSHKDQLTNILVIMGVGKYIYILRHYSSSPPSSNFGTPFFSELFVDTWKGSKKMRETCGVPAAELHVAGGLGPGCAASFVYSWFCVCLSVCRQKGILGVGSECFSKITFIPIVWLLSRRK